MERIMNAAPRNIGKVVKVQAIPRSKADRGVLLNDKAVTATGVLQSFGYNHEAGEFYFRLEGDPVMTTLVGVQYAVEIFTFSDI